MDARFGGLWRRPDFVKLWAGQTISVFGTLVSRVALPFAAVLALNASAFQIGLLRVAELVPGLLLGLVAGVWVDRLRRRPIMIVADLGRALLLATIPLAALADVLDIGQLYVVAFLGGALAIFFDVAYRSYLPSVVSRDELVEGNSKLSASMSVAEMGAFGLGGWLVQAITAPFAIAIDALSFVLSALSIWAIRKPEPPPTQSEDRIGMRREIVEGARVVLRNPTLRRIAIGTVAVEFAFSITGAVWTLYVLRALYFHPGVLGMIYAVGGVSSLGGAVLAGRLSARFGLGRTLALSLIVAALGSAVIPLARGAGLLSVALLVLQQCVTDPAVTVYEINAVSLQQAITPERLLGRMNASLRFIGIGAMIIGSLIGGVLGDLIGLRPTLWISVAGMAFGGLWILFSPVFTLRRPPESAPAGEAAVAAGG